MLITNYYGCFLVNWNDKKKKLKAGYYRGCQEFQLEPEGIVHKWIVNIIT